MFKRLWDWYANLFRAPTMEEIQNHAAEKAIVQAQQARSVIDSHEYQLHMAENTLDGIESWRVKKRAQQA